MPKKTVAKRAQQVAPGLAIHASAAWVEELLRARQRLLRDVQKKKQQLEQARARAERDAMALSIKIAPLRDRHTALVRELSELFEELLTEGRLSLRARKEVRQVRSSLERQGVLTPLDEDGEAPADSQVPGDEEEADDWAEPTNQRRKDDPSGTRAGARGAVDPSVRDVESAAQPGQERRSLRELFRSLARAVHPDRAQQEPDRERRTEVMKQVTRAYEDGDLARLIELEQTWQKESVLFDGGDPEARCRELARINRELLNQVRQLTREIRDVKRAAPEASLGPIEHIVEQAEVELDELATIAAFVRKFRDGKMTLTEFARGPNHTGFSEDEMAQIIENFLMQEVGDEAPAPAPRGRGKRRRSR